MTEQRAGSRILSLATLTVRGLAPWEIVDCARATGYSHVGLRVLPVIPGEQLVDLFEEANMRRLEAKLAETGLGVLDIEFLWLRPDTNLRDQERLLALCQRLGARALLLAGGDPDRARFLDRWLELCELAAPFGVRPHIEFMPLSDIRTYADAVSVMQAAPHPNAGIAIDTLHFDRGGSRASEILPAHHAWMSYMQLCDGHPERPTTEAELLRQAREDRLPPGQGGLDLDGSLRALPPDLPISVECPLIDAPHVPALERARIAMDATRRVLASLAEPIA